MPKPLTLYRGDRIQRNVYPDEVQGWLANGWSLSRKGPTISTDTPEPVELLNINTANAEQIAEALNGVGPSRAKKIIQKRDRLGEFTAIEEIPFLDEEHTTLITLGGE